MRCLLRISTWALGELFSDVRLTRLVQQARPFLPLTIGQCRKRVRKSLCLTDGNESEAVLLLYARVAREDSVQAQIDHALWNKWLFKSDKLKTSQIVINETIPNRGRSRIANIGKWRRLSSSSSASRALISSAIDVDIELKH